ncbi:MAG: hypothetical protein M3145_11495 [Pseudomonadota bacterium]|nr:hypothetical protein [Pseudomonadota bacterium]
MAIPGYDGAITALRKWLSRGDWEQRFTSVTQEHLGAVFKEFDLGVEDLLSLVDQEIMDNVMDAVFEDFLTREFEDGANIVADYLKRRSWKESAAVKRCLQALRDSIVSLYEVSDLAPGSHFMVRDLIRGGEPIRVEDDGDWVQESLVRWDRMAGRLITLGGRTYMTPALLHLSFAEAARILEEFAALTEIVRRSIEEQADQIGLPPERLQEAPVEELATRVLTPIITGILLGGVLDRAFEDEEFGDPDDTDLDAVYFETAFPIPDPSQGSEIESRLDARPDLIRISPDELGWRWVPEAGRTGQALADPSGLEAVETDDMPDENVRGLIMLEADTLVAETFDREQTEQCCRMLAEALGPLIGTPSTTERSPREALEQVGAMLRDFAELPPEAKKESMDRYYRDVLSTPIDMLDGQSPREAVASEAGRRKVVEWLKLQENNAAHFAAVIGETQPYDYTWIWEELNLGDLRRKGG